VSAAQRNKGARGERELFAMLTLDLGVVVKRNLSQTRGGGADGIDVPGFAIEVKRQERLALPGWWAQAVDQAGDKIAVLFYRQSRHPWRAVIDLYDLDPDTFTDRHLESAVITYEAAVQFIRERLPRTSSPRRTTP
jgi:hypothetical protein